MSARVRSRLSMVLWSVAATMLISAADVAAQPSSPPAGAGVVAVTDGDGFAGAAARSVAVGADGTIVMVGTRGSENPPESAPDAVATAWTSKDGLTWSAIALPDGGKAEADRVAAGPAGGFVAVGSTGLPGDVLVWTSPDGSTWTTAARIKGSDMNALIPDADGYLAAGMLGTGCKKSGCKSRVPAMWSSSDGVDWQATKLPAKAGSPVAIARDGSGVTVVATNLPTGNPPTPSLVVSTDGSHWQQVDYPTTPGTSYELVRGLAVSPGGFVLTSETEGIWSSPDGVQWTLTLAKPGFNPVVSGDVVDAFNGGLQASSADGTTWQQTTRDGMRTPIAAAHLADGRSIVVGIDLSGSAPAVVVYLLSAAAAPSIAP